MLEAWYAAFVPKGTPPEIINKLNAEMNKALKDPKLIDTFTKGAIEAVGGAPEEHPEARARRFGKIRAACERAEHQAELSGVTVRPRESGDPVFCAGFPLSRE